ncbi:MAG: hypothetical protein ACT4O3_07455 [Elusimicrobiota bacterium]
MGSIPTAPTILKSPSGPERGAGTGARRGGGVSAHARRENAAGLVGEAQAAAPAARRKLTEGKRMRRPHPRGPEPRKKRSVLFAAALWAAALSATVRAEDEDYNLDAQALPGYTGYALAPSARTLGYREAGLALHRFVLGLAYGWPRGGEFGVSFDLQDVTPVTPFTRDTYRARAPFFSFHGKYRLLRGERHGLDASLGIWRHTYYAALATPPWKGFRLEGGPSLRRRADDTHAGGHFGALSRTFGVQRVFVDYESQARGGSFGWRYLLSEAIRLDAMITRLGRRGDFFEKFFFGLTIAD